MDLDVRVQTVVCPECSVVKMLSLWSLASLAVNRDREHFTLQWFGRKLHSQYGLKKMFILFIYYLKIKEKSVCIDEWSFGIYYL
jgi:hypothetical protein